MVPITKSLDIESNEWVKGDLIGSGSFGSVHLAMNTNGKLFVAKSSKSPIGLESLENEGNILMNLNSPYVVQYLGKEITQRSDEEQPTFNIFMEHMGGGSLSDLIDKFQGPLFEGAIRSYTQQILMGLSHLHEKGIVHCDIKCKNILLDSFGNVKLADFGCSQVLNSGLSVPKRSLNLLQCKQSIKGTPLWMSPELLKDGRLSFGADIWSLGCTIIEMATGKPPSWGNMADDPMTLVLKIALGDDKPRYPKRFSDQGLDFLERCLERDPYMRWTAKELLNHPFISDNKDSQMNMTKGTIRISSPPSVLDLKSFDVGLSDNEDEIMSPSRGSILSKYHINEVLDGSFLDMKTNWDDSGDWVTIRSI